jgi:hypothetical protein
MKTCDTCSACCFTHGVDGIKAKGEACKYLANGCSIYSTRPEQCKSFYCLWMLDGDGFFRLAHRPDRLGIVLDRYRPLNESLVAIEYRPGALGEDEVKKLLSRLRKRGHEIALVSYSSENLSR